MSFELTEEHRALAGTVRDVLEKHAGSAAVRKAVTEPRGYDEALWSTLCGQVGIAALAIPEQYGGVGASIVETHIVLEELGKNLTPSPMLGSVVLAAHALLASEDTAGCERLLPSIGDGTATAALAWSGQDGTWSVDQPPVASDSAARLTGEACYVLDGDTADVLLVPARTAEGVGLFEVDPLGPGVHREHATTMDVTRRLATVRLDGASGHRLGTGDYRPALGRVRDVACAGLAAESVGAASSALRATVDYTKERTQFGRPIGSFQALKHRMADAYVLVESARSAARAAAASLSSRDPEAGSDAVVAKVYCTEALEAVAAEMIQLHGGIAITWEHDAHLYFKRAHADLNLFGPTSRHLHRGREYFRWL